jgi:4-hydroxymandelate oxidase
MYSTVPPRSGGARDDGAGWGLRRAVRLAFPDPAELAGDDVHTGRLDVYLSDLLGQYALGLEPGALEPGGQSYGEMAEALIKLAVPEGESVDLLVLAYAIPDITPGRATATYLSHVCPGRPMSFAVSDQGTAAGFTGLRLIRDHARSGGPRRALLLVVEQAALPYDPGVPVAVPAGHSGVALLLGDLSETSDTPDPAGRSGSAARLEAVSVYPALAADALADQVGALFAGATGSTAILGAALAAQVPAPTGPSQVRVASAGQPYTGVWWELAGALAEADVGTPRIQLADYAPEAQYLCFAAIDAGRDFASEDLEIADTVPLSGGRR